MAARLGGGGQHALLLLLLGIDLVHQHVARAGDVTDLVDLRHHGADALGVDDVLDRRLASAALVAGAQERGQLLLVALDLAVEQGDLGLVGGHLGVQGGDLPLESGQLSLGLRQLRPSIVELGGGLDHLVPRLLRLELGLREGLLSGGQIPPAIAPR